jgi:predicted esterase
MYGRVALIFLHGSGGCGSDMRGFLESLPIPQYQYHTFREVLDNLSITLFTPTAQVRRYSAAGGQRLNVWFDRSPRFQMEGMSASEDLHGVEVSMNALASMIRGMEEEEPYDHYILGGFSMGGGLSLHALRKQITPKLRGVFCLSSFAPHGSAILTELSPAAKTLPIMMMHGEDDSLIPCEWGRQTSTNFILKELKVQFRTYPDLGHDMSEDEVLPYD